jgi:hypothetical protein
MFFFKLVHIAPYGEQSSDETMDRELLSSQKKQDKQQDKLDQVGFSQPMDFLRRLSFFCGLHSAVFDTLRH